MKYVFRFICTVIMIWLTEVILVSLIGLRYSRIDSNVALWFGSGVGIGLVIFSKWRLVPIYVFGHEATHWLIGKLFLRKTSKFCVHASSGSVRVERPNIWIILGPYIVPFYMLLFMLVYGGVVAFVSLPQLAILFCLEFLGLLYAYHIVLTIVALMHGQSDLDFRGRILSLTFIVLFNVLFLYIGLSVITMQFGQGMSHLWDVGARQAVLIWEHFISLMRGLIHSGDGQ